MRTSGTFGPRRRCGAALGLVVVLLAGCQSAPLMNVRQQQFNDQLALSTQAINVADLEQARDHLDRARRVATAPQQQRKVRSLERLVTGAEAMMRGDTATARAEWSRIEEPHLYAEVRHKARLMGVDVPEAPTRGETQ